MTNSIYGIIGLAAKAGAIISGSLACESVILKGRAKLVIIAGDSADNTKKKFLKIAANSDAGVRVFGTSEELGHYCGKVNRSVAVITETNFAKKLTVLIDDLTRKNGGGLIGKDQSI